MSLYDIDEFGRAVVSSEGLFELWFNGEFSTDVAVISDPEVERYNQECRRHGKDDFVIVEPAPPLTHEQRKATWTIPESCLEIDVEEWCIARCARDDERDRVRHEMKLYREREMVPVLRALIHIVDVLRSKNIMWGIGRGSSVASYVLFLIGVHRIDSIRFGLAVEDFLR